MNTAAVYAPQPVDGQPAAAAATAAGPAGGRSGPPTARTVVLLREVLRHLGELGRRRVTSLGDRPVAEADDDLFTALPGFTWNQSAAWRGRFVAAFDVLADRLGPGLPPEPGTAAEEFALLLAIVQADLLLAVQPELVERAVAGTAADAGDFDWRGCHESLFRHDYVPVLLQAEFAGLEDPRHPVNQHLQIGDYRPENWFRPFG